MFIWSSRDFGKLVFFQIKNTVLKLYMFKNALKYAQPSLGDDCHGQAEAGATKVDCSGKHIL